jgi:transposase InsO family protein
MSDFEEAHSKKVISLCNKYGIVKRASAGYTPQHNAIMESWFRMNGEMSRCQLSQFNMEEKF